MGDVTAPVASAQEFPPCIDMVVGLPTYGSGVGAVDLRYQDGSHELLTVASLEAGPVAVGDRFGSAVERSGCHDLLIGAPGSMGTGAVYFAGLRNGVWNTTRVAPPELRSGDEFGAAVTGSSGHFGVGAPGREVDGAEQAGAVFEFYRDDGGFAYVKEIWDQARNLPGTPEPGDRLGEVLDGWGADDDQWILVIGQPYEDIGAAVDAGMVTLTHQQATFESPPVAFHRDAPGMPGAAEAKDRLGAAVELNRGDLWVGVPGEDIELFANAGVVQTFDYGDGGFEPDAALSQDSPGISGAAEAGDRFGAAVASVPAPCADCEYPTCLAIGAPGEDVGVAINAGWVLLHNADAYINPDYGPACPRPYLAQGHGLGGALEAGDRTGARLAAPGTSGDILWLLGVGAPGEDIDGVTDAGVVRPWDLRAGAAAALTLSPRPEKGLRYGSVL